jgi:hypothetical protein
MSADFAKGRSTRHELQIARGVALDAYSGFEQILLQVFVHLLGTNMKLGGIIFFRLQNSGLRIRILTELIEAKFNDRYDRFWFGTDKVDGLMDLIAKLDQRRNEIVHWTTIASGSSEAWVIRPPHLWSGKKGPRSLHFEDVYEFVARCHCLRHYAGNFNWRTRVYREGEDSEKARAWLDIFEQPPSYPPGQDHPLSRIWTESQIPRLSSLRKSRVRTSAP